MKSPNQKKSFVEKKIPISPVILVFCLPVIPQQLLKVYK